MKVSATKLPGLLLIEPTVFADDRGTFMESFSKHRYATAGILGEWVQDNVSHSRRGVLRGLHYQHPRAQGKLMSVVHGAAFDVAVDVRAGSPTHGEWVGMELSAENRRQLYIPPGFAHGFQVISSDAIVLYKCSDYYDQGSEHSILWSDEEIAIDWPLEPILSPKDRDAPRLREFPAHALPPFDA